MFELYLLQFHKKIFFDKLDHYLFIEYKLKENFKDILQA